MKNFTIALAIFYCFLISCTAQTISKEVATPKARTITIEQANQLAELPLSCIQKEYPNKLGQTLGYAYEIGEPSELHPAFYGCFDWHSSVHGHWSLVTLLNEFPQLDKRTEIIRLLKENITEHTIQTELNYFKRESEKSFERTYGWAWLLQLQLALNQSEIQELQELAQYLQPLSDYMAYKYEQFLPKLVYPIRVGEHTNTAFGLSFAYDYASRYDSDLQQLIRDRAKDFYVNDSDCPINWEPSGYDFLSPCLQEIDLMRKVLPQDEFLNWTKQFMPGLFQKDFTLEVGLVGDRTDGKLVHLDGLNFSRAWVLSALAQQYPEDFLHLQSVADNHLDYSYPNLVGDRYEGGHWLASFAIYALLNNN